MDTIETLPPAATPATQPAGGPPDDAATQPVVEPVRPAGARRSSRARWAAALAVLALVSATALAGVGLIAAGGSSSALAPWAPATTTVYAEMRTDLPGDQQGAVGALLARFPGFDDQAALDMKVDTAIGDLVARASGATVDYGRDLEPWLGGEIALAVGSLDTVEKTADGAVSGGWALLLSTTKDPAATQAFLEARLGAPTATTTIGTATVNTVAAPEVQGRTIAWSIVGTTVLIGDRAAVESAIDAQRSGGLAATAGFSAASAQVPAEHVAMAWADLPTLADAARAAREAMAPDASPLPSMPAGHEPPPWVTAWIRAEAGGATLDVVAPRPADVAVGAPRVSTIASRLPGITVAAVEVHDVGALVQRALDAAAKEPGLADQLGAAAPVIDGALGSFVDWAGDGAVAVTRSGGEMHGGIVVAADEPSVAATRIAAIRAFLAFVDGPNGRPVVTERPYGDGTIVTVDFGDVRDAIGKAIGDAAGGAGAPSADDLARIRELLPSSATVVYTVQRGVFVLGTDAAFVEQVVDTTPADSLATDPDYRAAIDLAGPSNDGQAFVDASAVLEMASTAETGAVEVLGADVAPFTGRIQSLGAAYTAADDVIRLRLAIAVRAR
ncbi:MAG: DUF3352 domain-containing protein [Chloroflexi bacterium]|jgi:hypothetical protein|nr:DUF3352 domain-containing protein [Chloroflexota bacterium]